MVWIKAQWHVQQAIEAASEQSRASQQNERDHQFNHHHVRSQPSPEPADGAVVPVGQSVRYLLKRQPECGHCGQQESSQQCDHRGKRAGARIKANASQERHVRHHVLGDHETEEPHDTSSNDHACHAAEQSKQEPFGNELPRQAPASRAQCAPHRRLPPAALRTHQHQAAHVDASDQQEQHGPA